MAAPARSWLEACEAFGRAHDVGDGVHALLEAFATPHPRGGPPPPPEQAWPGSFEALEREATRLFDPAALERRLHEEIEGAQPGVFRRRVEAVERLLGERGDPSARVLRVGLLVRLAGILAAEPPRARRVRALADFYYSAAARLAAATRSGRPATELVQELTWRALAPGLEHAVLDGRTEEGPVHVNLLRADPRGVEVTVEDCAASALAGRSFAEHVEGRAVAAISGGFFLYSETDIEPPSRRHDPVGLLVHGGQVRNPPAFRRGALLVAGEEIELRPVGLTDVALTIAGRPARVVQACNRAEREVGPDAPSVAVVGLTVVAVGRRLPVPLNGFVAELRGVPPPRVGQRVDCEPPRLASGAHATEALAGGPMLRLAGQAGMDMQAEDFWGTAPPITFSQDETGDLNLLARMAVGLDGEGRLLAAAVDGRNVERALGMTLAGTADLLACLGCHTVLNLDGGSSKRMLVEGEVVDLASTEIVADPTERLRARPVHTAILFQPRGR